MWMSPAGQPTMIVTITIAKIDATLRDTVGGAKANVHCYGKALSIDNDKHHTLTRLHDHTRASSHAHTRAQALRQKKASRGPRRTGGPTKLD
jgi:hypothetical protein